MSLLYSEGDFSRGMRIVNTAGWDTDCNSGNVGCILGVSGGLAGLEAGPDWRGPVADRLVLPTADVGRAVTDAANEALQVAAIGCHLAGVAAPAPKAGARYHFELPGSLQGWLVNSEPACCGLASLRNAVGHSLRGTRSLAIDLRGVAHGRRARVHRETYPDMGDSGGYGMVAAPTLYPGQTLSARLEADGANNSAIEGRLYVEVAGQGDSLETVYGPLVALAPGEAAEVAWQVTVPEGSPILWVGLEFGSESRFDGTVYLDTLTWKGEPQCTFGRPQHNGTRWLSTWTAACSALSADPEATYRMIQNEGRGLALMGARQWRNYTLEATLTANLARTMGLAARVQGLRRYYALELTEGSARLVRERYGTTVLASVPFEWSLYRAYRFELTVNGQHLTAAIDGMPLFDLDDESDLHDGAIAIVLEEGRLACGDVSVRPT